MLFKRFLKLIVFSVLLGNTFLPEISADSVASYPRENVVRINLIVSSIRSKLRDIRLNFGPDGSRSISRVRRKIEEIVADIANINNDLTAEVEEIILNVQNNLNTISIYLTAYFNEQLHLALNPPVDLDGFELSVIPEGSEGDGNSDNYPSFID